jgi:diaminopimelate decarboxylase
LWLNINVLCIFAINSGDKMINKNTQASKKGASNKLDYLQLKQLQEKYDTPFYLYDADTIRNNVTNLQQALGFGVDIFYSLKANPNISIASLILQQNVGAEVCSTAELMTAMKAGYPSENIIFVGPYKKDLDIELCLLNKIYAIVCESFQELEQIHQLARRHGVIAPVLLRINPDFYAKNALLKMGGKPSQFGIDQDQINEAFQFIKEHASLNLLGIHIYNGTRILNAACIAENTQHILKYAADLQDQYQCQFTTIDIGGGAGIPYFEGETDLDLILLRELIHPIVHQYQHQFPHTRIIMESGRYLVGSAGNFIISARSIKAAKGKTFIVADGGTNCHMSAVGVGSLVKNNFPMRVIQEKKSGNQVHYEITGPLCTPNDLLAKNILLPEVAVNDFIEIAQSGAYGPSASPTGFLSHGHPAEFLLDDNTTHLIRAADKPDDLLCKQVLIYQQPKEKINV